MHEVQPIRSKRDIERMKSTLQGRNRLLLIFGINSGLRISDILRLEIADVIESNGKPKASITLHEQKTGKAKTFAFNRSILAELNGIDYAPHAYLFASRKGSGPISRVQAYRILNEAAQKCGLLEPIGTHTLRKTFGYHAYKAGVDLSLLMRIFNHSSQAVTLRYIGITQDAIDDVYEAINL